MKNPDFLLIHVILFVVVATIGCGREAAETVHTEDRQSHAPDQTTAKPELEREKTPIESAIEKSLQKYGQRIPPEISSVQINIDKVNEGWLVELKLNPRSQQLGQELLISVPDGEGEPTAVAPF